ncbi:MAG: hypothetical protein LKM36_05475 [Flavobacteriales bacterium]|jgi:hypothetical protein|nr:hypothetical protein [Flavobacteriales bacterium]
MDIAPEGEGQCGTGIIFASMDNPFHTYIPEGFATVNAYLFVDTPNALITFLKNAFFRAGTEPLRGQAHR